MSHSAIGCKRKNRRQSDCNTIYVEFSCKVGHTLGQKKVKKPMYQPLPPIREDLNTLEEQLRRERAPKRKPRLHLLVLLKSGQVTSRSPAATPLALHRNTVATWLRHYRDRGLEALLTYKEAGAPAGQQTLPPAVFEQLKTRLATSSGSASSIAFQQWRRDAFGLEVPYTTLHGIVRSQLQAKLKWPRPRHAKKTSRRRLTLSNRARAASGLWPPEDGRRPHNLYGSFARMQVASACPCLSTVGSRAMA